MTNQQQTAISNFLSTLDKEAPKRDHIKNAMRDAMLYKWKTETLIALLLGIEKIYETQG